MSIKRYENANVAISSDTFGGMVERVNQLSNDMSEIVLTTNPTGEANETDGGFTEGNAGISGDFSSNNIFTKRIRGGDALTETRLEFDGEVKFNGNTIFTGSTSMERLVTPPSSYVSLSDAIVVNQNETTIRQNDLNLERGIVNLASSNLADTNNRFTNIGLRAIRNNSESSYFTYRESENAWVTETAIKADRFVGSIEGTAQKLESEINLQLTGDVEGSASFDGSGDVQINTTYARPVVKDFRDGDNLPTEDIGVIWSSEYNSLMRWMVFTNGGANYRGYASVDIGRPEFDAVQNERPGYLFATGKVVSKTGYYEALWHYALHNYLVNSYERGKFRYENTNGSSFRVPDVRGEFVRVLAEGRGSDPNADRAIGSHQGDAYASHNHGMSETGHHSHGMSTAGNHRHNFGANDGDSNDDARYPWSRPDGSEFLEYTNYDGDHTHNIYGAGSHRHSIYHSGGPETRPRNFALPMSIKV